MNNKFNELSKSDLDLLSKFNFNYDSSNPVLTKIIEHIIYNYNKLNNEIIASKYQNEVLVDKIENILIINNKLLFHFKLSLLLIILIIIIHLYYVISTFS